MDEKKLRRSLEKIKDLDYSIIFLGRESDDEGLKQHVRDTEKSYMTKIEESNKTADWYAKKDPEEIVERAKTSKKEPLSYAFAPTHLGLAGEDTPITFNLADSYESPIYRTFDYDTGNNGHFTYLFGKAFAGERILNNYNPENLPKFNDSLTELVNRYIELEEKIVEKIDKDFSRTLEQSDYPRFCLKKKVIDVELNELPQERIDLINQTLRFYLFLKSVLRT